MKKLVASVAVLSLVVLAAPAYAATSRGLGCKVVSYSYVGSNGTTAFYDYRVRIKNDRHERHRIHVVVRAEQSDGGGREGLHLRRFPYARTW